MLNRNLFTTCFYWRNVNILEITYFKASFPGKVIRVNLKKIEEDGLSSLHTQAAQNRFTISVNLSTHWQMEIKYRHT